jgi:hypothetical protein
MAIFSIRHCQLLDPTSIRGRAGIIKYCTSLASPPGRVLPDLLYRLRRPTEARIVPEHGPHIMTH